MYQNDALKCLTGECRLSYCHLDKPYAPPGSTQAPKFGVTLLIPKTDYATKADIDQAIQAAIAEGVSKTWGGKRPAQPAVPVWDGDGKRANGEDFGPECRGHWVITASTKDKPQVVHISNVRAELAPTDIYSGMYGRVTIRFFAYDQAGKRGIGCGLGNVMKTRDGEPLAAGRSNAEDDFAGLEQQTAAPGYPPANPMPGYGTNPTYPPSGYPAQPAYPNQPGYPQPQVYPGYSAAAPTPYPAAAPAPYPGAVHPVTGQPM